MAYISVSLSPTDPQPGNYSIYISPCVSGSTKTLVKSGLKNPLDFPYTFNTEDFLPNEECLNYELVDRRSDCKKTGTISLLPPSETPKPSNTPTPTNTPLPSNVFDVIINANISSGSTTAEYTVVTSRKVPEDYVIKFINTFYDISGNTYPYNITITVPKGTQIGKRKYGLPSPEYSKLRKDRYHIEVLSSSIYEAKINRYGDFKFLSTDDDDNPQGYTIPWRFRICCDEHDTSPQYITINVPISETEPGGWVFNGEVVTIYQDCYEPIGQAPFNGQISIPDSDYQSCQASQCVDLCDTYINVGLKLTLCCDETYAINIVASVPNLPSIGSTVFLSSSDYPVGCYRVSDAWQTIQPNTIVIDDILPDCPSCYRRYIGCDTKNFRAINCCDSNNQITVTVDSSSPPTVNSSLQQGFIWNGQCWKFTNQNGFWYDSVGVIYPNQYLNYPCENDLCPECNTPTPTPTPTSTPGAPYPPEIKTIRIQSCCNQNIFIADAIAEFLVPPVVGEFIYYTGGFDENDVPVNSGCYKLLAVDNTNIPVSVGQVIASYDSSDCTPCFDNFDSCIQVFESCNQDCGEVLPYEGQTDTHSYNNITYNVPLTINNVCDLLPLADSNYFVSDYAMFACAEYHYFNQTPCSQIPWLCEQVGASGDLGSTDVVDAFYLTIPQLSTTCSSLPCTIYGQGLSANLNFVYLSNDFDSCYTYIGNESPNGQVLTVFNLGEEFSGCTECQPLTPTPTPTITQTPTQTIIPPQEPVWEVRLQGCCDDILYLDYITFTPSNNPQVGDYFYWQGNSQYPEQCYEILDVNLSSQELPNLTLEVELSSGGCSRCEETHPCNIVWRAINCCNNLLSLNVTVDLNSPPIVGQGFINPLDGECYQFIQISSAVGDIEINPTDYIDNVCGSDNCPLCPSATPTNTPTNTQTPTTTPTPTPTQTPYTVQNDVMINTCCIDECGNEYTGELVNILFNGNITSVSVGDFIIIDGIAYQVTSINSTIPIAGVNITIDDSQIIVQPPLGCNDPLVLPYLGSCYNNYLSGCTTGNIYIFLGPPCIMYNEIGDTLYSEELFGEYGDYCATVIDGDYNNPITIISFTEIPTVNGCYSSECDVPVTPTPTTTPTTTPTPTMDETPTPTPTPTSTLESCEDDNAGGLIHENEGTIVYPSPTPTMTPTVSPNYIAPSIKTVFIHVPNA